MGRFLPRHWLEPELPTHLRDDFVTLAAQHLRGQSRLLFIGFILSLPMVIAARAGAAPAWVWLGLPALIFALSLIGLWVVHDRPRDADRSMILMRRAWLVSMGVASAGSLWAVESWGHAPVQTRVYYVAIMSVGALTMGYTLTAARAVGVTALTVSLVPISVALLHSENRLDWILAACLLIGVAFQALLIGRHQRLLLELVQERNHSSDLARIDPLTGIPNRRALLESAEAIAKDGVPIRLIILDIDRFKAVNDRYGHETGDEVLMIVATLLTHYADNTIHLARIGGEEFALIGKADQLPPRLADRVLADIRNAEMPHGETLTASIGMASGSIGRMEGWTELYGKADSALYRAKADGRDRAREYSDWAEPQPRKSVGG